MNFVCNLADMFAGLVVAVGGAVNFQTSSLRLRNLPAQVCFTSYFRNGEKCDDLWK